MAEFHADAIGAYGRARTAINTWLSAFPNAVRRPRDLQLATELDYTLCWQIMTVVKSEGVGAAAHVPGPVSLKRMVAESRRQKLPEKAISILQEGLGQFYAAAKVHADSRAGFGNMIAAVTSTDPIELSARKAAYRAESDIWGMQIGVYHQMVVFSARPTSETMTALLVTSKLNFRRLRPNASRSLWGFYTDPTGQIEGNDRPLDEAAFSLYHAPLIPRFCSDPLPKIRMVRHDNDWTFCELDGDGIGRQSAVDMSFGLRSQCDPLLEGIENRFAAASAVRLSNPAELLVLDILVHRPSFGVAQPQLLVHANSPDCHRLSVARQVQQLPIDAKVIHLRSDLEGFRDRDVARAPEIAEYLIHQSQLNLDEMDLFRVKVPFPILNSIVKLYFEIGA